MSNLSYSDLAFILKVKKYGEADLIVHVLCRNGSKQVLMAKNALRSRRRFGGGVLEPTHLVHLSFGNSDAQRGRGLQRLPLLSEAQIKEDFRYLRNSYERIQLGLYFVDLVDRVSFEATQDTEAMFWLLGHALRAATTVQDLQQLKKYFEIKFLHCLGLWPQDFMHVMETPLKHCDQSPLEDTRILSVMIQQFQQLFGTY